MGMDSNKNSPRTADRPDEIGALPFWLRAGIIILAALWIYSPAMRGDWLWDDDWYITNQPLMRDLSGLFKFWFEPGSWVEYYPLEETVLWIEWHLFGTDTLGYHLVTLALHIGNALLVWRLLDKFGLRKAWIGGLIFAVHPAMVESAAWIAETKNTLSTFPCLLAACVWIDYDNRRQPRDYAFAILYFTAALLCKIAVAPLPLALLLYAWWKRRHIGRSDLAALVPFVIIAVVVCGISLAGSQMYTKIEPKTWPLPVLTFPARLLAFTSPTFSGLWTSCRTTHSGPSARARSWSTFHGSFFSLCFSCFGCSGKAGAARPCLASAFSWSSSCRFSAS